MWYSGGVSSLRHHSVSAPPVLLAAAAAPADAAAGEEGEQHAEPEQRHVQVVDAHLRDGGGA